MMSSKKYLTTICLSIMITGVLTQADSGDDEPKKPLPNCMYCKRMDTVSSFMYSYSYCPELDECLEDAWNYYNIFCESGWKAGFTLDIDLDCRAQEAERICPKPIKATAFEMGKFINTTQNSLPPGGKCTVKVDATEVATMLVFANNTQLGVNYNHYKVGKEMIAV